MICILGSSSKMISFDIVAVLLLNMETVMNVSTSRVGQKRKGILDKQGKSGNKRECE